MKSLISLCVPCMNRLEDLIQTMPHMINAANASPPVEIAVVNYSSKDKLEDYIFSLMDDKKLIRDNFINYKKYTGRDTYHAAHANNLAMLLGGGDYIVLIPADVFITIEFIPILRNLFKAGCIWCNTKKKHRSTIAIKRTEFIASGGYDERFEMYGPDDIDIIERLERRGLKHGFIPDEVLSSIYTSPDKKVANYRVRVSHKELGKMSMPYYYENRDNKVLVANIGRTWGEWE